MLLLTQRGSTGRSYILLFMISYCFILLLIIFCLIKIISHVVTKNGKLSLNPNVRHAFPTPGLGFFSVTQGQMSAISIL